MKRPQRGEIATWKLHSLCKTQFYYKQGGVFYPFGASFLLYLLSRQYQNWIHFTFEGILYIQQYNILT